MMYSLFLYNNNGGIISYIVIKELSMLLVIMCANARERGYEEGLKKSSIKIAKNMLSMDMNIEDISKYTELSISEIESLKN